MDEARAHCLDEKKERLIDNIQNLDTVQYSTGTILYKFQVLASKTWLAKFW
jgi:hypothetical protein